MGLNFLVTLRKTMGNEAWLSALRAIYLEFGYERLCFHTFRSQSRTRLSIGRSWSTRRRALEVRSETFSDGSTVGHS